MGVAYGDQWSNLIQPFWTIPLLAIAGLPLQSVLRYSVIMFFFSGVFLGAALLGLGHFGMNFHQKKQLAMGLISESGTRAAVAGPA